MTGLLQLRTGLIIGLVVGMVGCAGGPREVLEIDYNDQRNQTTYRTQRISTIFGRAAGYASPRRLQLRAWASCQGEACQPNEVMLQFATGGGNELYIAERTVTFTADGREYEWINYAGSRNVMETGRVVGEIAKITLPSEQFIRIAQAESVEGRLGTTSFRLSYGERKPFRELAQRLAGDALS